MFSIEMLVFFSCRNEHETKDIPAMMVVITPLHLRSSSSAKATGISLIRKTLEQQTTNHGPVLAIISLIVLVKFVFS